MRVQVKVYPCSRTEKITKDLDLLKVYLTVQPQRGKANKRLLEVLAPYLKVKKSALKIIKGKTARNKLIEIG